MRDPMRMFYAGMVYGTFVFMIDTHAELPWWVTFVLIGASLFALDAYYRSSKELPPSDAKNTR